MCLPTQAMATLLASSACPAPATESLVHGSSFAWSARLTLCVRHPLPQLTLTLFVKLPKSLKQRGATPSLFCMGEGSRSGTVPSPDGTVCMCAPGYYNSTKGRVLCVGERFTGGGGKGGRGGGAEAAITGVQVAGLVARRHEHPLPAFHANRATCLWRYIVLYKSLFAHFRYN